MEPKIEVVVSCATHKGSKQSNEDSFSTLVGGLAPCGTKALIAVADGMSGLGNGGYASSLALKVLADVFSASCSIADSTNCDVPHLLRYAVQKANAAVFQSQVEDESLKGMGTTCVAAAVTDDWVHLVSIGDSRAYLCRGGKLIPLTKDEWVKRSDGVTLVTRAIGWQPILPAEPASYDFTGGDYLLLCSDGLTDVIEESKIAEIVSSGDCAWASDKLVHEAGELDGSDNVTVVIAKLITKEN